MSNPICSIIIPAYKAKETVERSINSCIEQTLFDLIEVVVIINGPDDGTISLLEKYKEIKNIRVYHLSKAGRSSARNYGLKKAKGKYIQLLDADDEIEENKVKISIDFLEKNESYFAYCTQISYVKNSVELSSNKITISNNELLIHNTIPIHSPIFKKNDNLFDENFEFNEDWLFWNDVFYGKKIFINHHFIGGIVNIHDNNTMNNKIKMLESKFYIRGILKKKYKKKRLKFLSEDIKIYMIFIFLKDNKMIIADDKYYAQWNKGFKFIYLFFLIPYVKKKISKKITAIIEQDMYQ